MLPPSSPTSKSPFFNMQSGAATTCEATAGGSAAGHKTVTEVYNNVDLASAFMGDCSMERDDRTLATRRHTLGPGQPLQKHFTTPRPYLIPGQQGRATGILPQTNLTQNLPLVSNLPPENFSVK